MLVQKCNAEPEHTHEYPDDWQFGGPDGTDPRLDPRLEPDTYLYRDDRLQVLHTTSQFVCDDQAVDYFTEVAGFGPSFNPVYIQVKRQGERDFHTLPFQYNRELDEVIEV